MNYHLHLKKREVDLKCKPSKSQIAAEKYKCSKFVTKLTHLPKPIRRRKGKGAASTASNLVQTQSQSDTHDKTNPGKTTTIPVTSQESQEAIKALLMLGNPPEQAAPDPDKNEILMSIAAPQEQDIHPVPPALPVVNLPDNPDEAVEHEPGTALGVAIKTDNVDNTPDADDQPQEIDDDATKLDDKNVKKKTFVTKEYGLKQRIKPSRKFKCGVCAAELDTVRDYNQHYLDNHPLTPCPYCPRLFSSPRTMAKHKYSHVELMYECKTCGQAFTLKSQYDSHHT